MKYLSTVLGERLIMLRKEKNLTQKQLAEELMCSATRLNYWEKGKSYPKTGVAFGRYENGSKEPDDVTKEIVEIIKKKCKGVKE